MNVGLKKEIEINYFLEFLRKWNPYLLNEFSFFLGGVGENLTDPSVIKPEDKQ